MNKEPFLSFIVLSYNYDTYIRQCLDSILAQTFQDFEIIVVDDCSTDSSVQVITEYNDPRIRLICNQHNLGGPASYNLAIDKARGEWFVNLDADDWIAPDKAEAQIALLEKHPELDIIGSWVYFVDSRGQAHPKDEELSRFANCSHDFNRPETWLGQNMLCRSSTMVRRTAHNLIGYADAGMVRAPDYELWTRALSLGCKFGLLERKLTYSRLHTGGVTHRDPMGTFLEMSYSIIRNLAPLADRACLFEFQLQILAWLANHEYIFDLTPQDSHKLASFFMLLQTHHTYTSFKQDLFGPDLQTGSRRIGGIGLFIGRNYIQPSLYDKLERDIEAYIEAREWWREQSNAYEEQVNIQRAHLRRLYSPSKAAHRTSARFIRYICRPLWSFIRSVVSRP